MNVTCCKHIPFRKDDRFLDTVLQLADIAAPAIAFQRRGRIAGKSGQRPVILLREALEEQFRHGHDVLPALPQGRQGDVHGIDAVIEVLAEKSLADHSLQVLVSRTDEADIHGSSFRAAHAYHAAVLGHPEQFSLQMKRDVAYFVQEERPAVGLFELAGMVCERIRERPLDVAEEFALEESLGDGSGIHGDHRLTGPGTPGVDFPRQDVLSGTVLACDEHRRVRAGNLVNGLADGGHGAGSAPEYVRSFAALRMTRGIPMARVVQMTGGLAGLVAGGGERGHQLFVLPRFDDEVEGSPFHPFYSQLDVGICREEYDLHPGVHLLDLPGPVEAFVAGIDAGVEIHVQQHDVGLELLQRRYERYRRRYGPYLREMHGQQYFQRPADAGVVVNDQYLPGFGSHLYLTTCVNSGALPSRART